MNEITKLVENIKNSETFCFYPFLELSTNPSGHVKPCCYYGNVLYKNEVENENNILNIAKDDTFEEVWNSIPIVNIRRSLANNKKLKECSTCYRDGKASMRERSIHEYIENEKVLNMVQDTINNDYIANYMPTRLELKPSNLCNLKCVMCNRYDSSQIEKELDELSKKYKGIEIYAGRVVKINISSEGISESNSAFSNIEDPDWSEKPEVWESFVKIAPNLESLSFAGGEPTLIPFVLKALKHCVDNGYAENITVFCSSNFTNLNKNFLEIIPKFKKFELIASIDGVGSINEYSRYPSKWSQVSTNYAKANHILNGTNAKILVNITVNLLTVMNLDEMLFWVDENYSKTSKWNEWPYNINLIWHPADQRIENLPIELRKIAIQRLLNYKQKSRVLREFPGMGDKVDLIINELNKPYTEVEKTRFNEFKNRIKILDEHRNISIKEYIPEIGFLFDE